MGFLDGLVSELTGDYRGTDVSNESKLGSALGGLLKRSVQNDLTPDTDDTSYDGTVIGGFDGNYKRNAWQNGISEENATAALQANLSDGWQITKLAFLENWDEQDGKMLSDIQNYITANNQVNNRDSFSHIVMRNKGGETEDGWVVFSHFLNQEGWMHGVFYFSAEC